MIYIFGHKNPDTDTVCSSIALSYLKNEQGLKTVPKVLGNINNETKFVLDYFKVDVPSYLNDVRVKVKNVKYDKKAFINEYASIDKTFKVMQREKITAIPLIDSNKKLTGFVTLKELAKYLIGGSKEKINTSLDNIIDAINAKVIIKCSDTIKGNLLIAGLKTETFKEDANIDKDTILIVGDREKIMDYAIDCGVKLLILPLNINVTNRIIKKAEEKNVNIIASELDTFNIANKIILSNYIRDLDINKNPMTVNNEDYYFDFKNMTHKVNYTNYPVVNNKGVCLGLIRLTGPNEYEKQKVILVDHNNMAQSVDGIEEAQILEIIDHHNLGAIGTNVPINFRSKPVGCTATMIYDMYKESKVTIPKNIAGLMLSAILSDTLLLTSPTTTDDDKRVSEKLASIAHVDIETYGLEMLKAASSIEGMSVEELVNSDFKTYNIDNKVLGIGQIMTLNFDIIKDNMSEFIDYLNNMVKTNFNYSVIFVTDIIKNGSYCIYNESSENIVEESFALKKIYEGVFIPKVVSRKKQILPSILSVLDGE